MAGGRERGNRPGPRRRGRQRGAAQLLLEPDARRERGPRHARGRRRVVGVRVVVVVVVGVVLPRARRRRHVAAVVVHAPPPREPREPHARKHRRRPSLLARSWMFLPAPSLPPPRPRPRPLLLLAATVEAQVLSLLPRSAAVPVRAVAAALVLGCCVCVRAVAAKVVLINLRVGGLSFWLYILAGAEDDPRRRRRRRKVRGKREPISKARKWVYACEITGSEHPLMTTRR